MPSGWTKHLCNRLSGIFAGKPARGPEDRTRTRGAQAPGADAGVRPTNERTTFLAWTFALLAAFLLILSPHDSPAATHGDRIVNSAWLESLGQRSASTSVSVTVVERTPSTLQFLKFAPESSATEALTVPPTAYGEGDSGGAGFAPLAPPVRMPSGEPILPGGELPLATTAIYHRGEPVFLRLADPDQNLNPARAETVLVTLDATGSGDTEILRLTETGPDTGLFAGYIQSSADPGAPFDGRLEVHEAGTVEARYVDIYDGSDVSTTATLFDPYGIVFDSRTGLPVDDVEITLVDAVSGAPATVYGDDGVSAFPATVTTGGTATDASGHLYDFRPGAFRFPFVAPGRYRLEMTPPGGYAAPSTVSDADLQNLPGAPYALVTGSRGEEFRLDPGPALRIDIPVDPVATGDLWLRKTAGKSRVAAGDFLPYRIEIENPNAGGAGGVTVTDHLPTGFRYRAGSARLDGEPIADPQIADDGRTLTFTPGDLPAESRVEIGYVVEVTAGARRGEAVNSAVAGAGNGVASNTAEAVVTVGEDFFRTSTFLMGRVFTGGCGQPAEDEADGLADARIYLEDGTYVQTDENGMFHFEGVRPGVHVVQLDLDSLPEQYRVVPCEENSRFAGRAYSQFVDLQGGSMWRTDFHVALKPRTRGEVSIALNGALAGATATFRVPIEVGGVPLRNLRLAVNLPAGVEYLADSATLDGDSVANAAEEDGLVFPLGNAAPDQALELQFRCRIAEGAPGELPASAVLKFDTPAARDLTTPPADNLLLRKRTLDRQALPEITVRPHFPTLGAELSAADRAEIDELAKQLGELDVLRLYAVGHTDNVRIAPHHRHIFADNVALSEARARSVVRYLGDKLNLPPAKIVLDGVGASQPIADNGTVEGRALNRRVEVRIQCEKVTETEDLRLVKDRSGEQTAGTRGLRPGETWDEEPAAAPSPATEPVPGLLSPTDGSVLANRIAAVRVRLDSKLKPRLLLDGAPVPADRIGFTMEDPETGLTLYSYIGIDFGDPGEHTLTIEGVGPFGNARFSQAATIVRTGEISAIRLVEDGKNIADGLTPVTLRLALYDAAGKVIRAPAQLEIRGGELRPPEERKAVESEADLDHLDNPEENAVIVDADGLVRFAPVQSAGRYTAVLGYGDRTLEVETYVRPQLRDWVMVGLAEGTVGYNTVSGNMESLPAGAEENLYDDERLAFFAKGRVLGKWLLTMAYDSDKPDRKDEELFQVIDPDSYYTLYGDASQQAYDAASAEKVYVKLEREQFYALFGDYTTGLTKTELARYSRRLTGFKSEYSGRYATFNVFASDTGQGFVKNELRGDGTSGLYRLSRRDIVLNSEQVTIEVRDRLQSEKIVSSRELTRHVDYNIDYEAGTIYFKEPVPSRDETFNPVYIVVDYETDGRGDTSLNYGGRGAVRVPGTGVEVGASAIHEEQDNTESDLYGVDATWDVTADTVVRAEYSTSDSRDAGESREGSAWLTEVAHNSERLAGRAYVRELETGFGLGQQRGSEEGTRKYGVEGVYDLNRELSLGGTLYRQVNLETDAVREVAQTDVGYRAERYSLTTGLRHARDEYADGEIERSTQALLGATYQPFERLTLRAAREQSILGHNESGDFPTRTALGAEYQLTSATSVYAAQEFTRGDDTESDSTRVGFKTTPWTGASVDSALEQQTGEYGPRMFALFGLNQAWQVNEHWSIDGSFDRNQTVREPDARDFDTDVPPASGDSEDYTAVSFGATYQLEKWSWANRLEYRNGDSEDKWGLFSAIVGEVHEGLGLSARARVFTTASDFGRETTDGEIRLGLAYRPLLTRWIILDRLDYRFGQEAGEEIDYNNWRLVNNLNANFKPNRRTQLSFQYGLKYVQENIEGQDFSGFTDLVGIEGRYDVTSRWDVGLRGSLLHSWESATAEFSTGASVGYQAMENTWVSLGYNFLGFRDEDFSRSEYTAQGPFLRFRLKFDQHTAGDMRDWLKAI